MGVGTISGYRTLKEIARGLSISWIEARALVITHKVQVYRDGYSRGAWMLDRQGEQTFVRLVGEYRAQEKIYTIQEGLR